RTSHVSHLNRQWRDASGAAIASAHAARSRPRRVARGSQRDDAWLTHYPCEQPFQLVEARIELDPTGLLRIQRLRSLAFSCAQELLEPGLRGDLMFHTFLLIFVASSLRGSATVCNPRSISGMRSASFCDSSVAAESSRRT